MKRVDVSLLLAEARECLRTLWNQFYRQIKSRGDPFDVVDAYKAQRSRILKDFLYLTHGIAGNVQVNIKPGVDPHFVLVRKSSRPQVITWEPLTSMEGLENCAFTLDSFYDFDDRGLIELRYVE